MELTKEYFEKFLTQQLASFKQEFASGFAGLKSEVDLLRNEFRLFKSDIILELRPIKDGIAEIKETVRRLDVREHEDTIAMLKDIVSLKAQVVAIEKRVRALEPSRAI